MDSTVVEKMHDKSDPFFGVEPNFGTKIWVELGRGGPQGYKMGPIGSDWPQKGFKFELNPIMYLINPNDLDLNPISSRAPQGLNSG